VFSALYRLTWRVRAHERRRQVECHERARARGLGELGERLERLGVLPGSLKRGNRLGVARLPQRLGHELELSQGGTRPQRDEGAFGQLRVALAGH
jgi:hypothetical protein